MNVMPDSGPLFSVSALFKVARIVLLSSQSGAASPIHIALQSGHPELLSALIASGALICRDCAVSPLLFVSP